MSPVQNIKVGHIDPDSEINVRRQGIEQNVEKVKASIQQHGYWPDQPIIVRPHPDPKSEYDYQHVTGQCRLKACLAIGLEEIPAFVLESKEQLDEKSSLSKIQNNIHRKLNYDRKTNHNIRSGDSPPPLL